MARRWLRRPQRARRHSIRDCRAIRISVLPVAVRCAIMKATNTSVHSTRIKAKPLSEPETAEAVNSGQSALPAVSRGELTISGVANANRLYIRTSYLMSVFRTALYGHEIIHKTL